MRIPIQLYHIISAKVLSELMYNLPSKTIKGAGRASVGIDSLHGLRLELVLGSISTD